MHPMAAPPSFTLRAAQPGDVASIVALIRELAEFEKLTHLLEVTPNKLHPHLFGERPVAEALVAEIGAAEIEDAEAAGTVDAESQADTEPHTQNGGPPPGERRVVAFALFFTNFSTFLAQPGLYLEDLYVQPDQRGRGIGQALLTRLAQLAVDRGYGRFEWSVLDWNEPAIRFYQRMGATVMPDWRICRITGEALQRFRA